MEGLPGLQWLHPARLQPRALNVEMPDNREVSLPAVWRGGIPVNNDSFACGELQPRRPVPATASGPLQDELACEVKVVGEVVRAGWHKERTTLKLRGRPHRSDGE